LTLRFAGLITVIVLLNMIPAIWEFALEIKYGSAKGNFDGDMAFLITNCVFTGIYFLEFLIKVTLRSTVNQVSNYQFVRSR